MYQLQLLTILLKVLNIREIRAWRLNHLELLMQNKWSIKSRKTSSQMSALIRKIIHLKNQDFRVVSNMVLIDAAILMKLESLEKNQLHIIKRITVELILNWERLQFTKRHHQNLFRKWVYPQRLTNHLIHILSRKSHLQDFILIQENIVILSIVQSKTNLGCQEWDNTITTKVWTLLQKEPAEDGSD